MGQEPQYQHLDTSETNKLITNIISSAKASSLVSWFKYYKTHQK
jgi:hypothetical protein